METVALVAAVNGYAVGIVRPGVVFALALYAYQFESLFGEPMIGFVMNLAPLGLAAIYGVWKRHFKLHSVDTLLLLFVIWLSITVIRAPDIQTAFHSYLKFLVLGPAYYVATRTILTTKQDCDRFARDFLWATIILSVLFGFSLESNEWGTRATIGEGNPVGISLAFNCALSAFLFYLVGEKSWRIIPAKPLDIIFCVLLVLLIFNFVIMNGTRGALLGPGIAIILFTIIFVLVRSEGTMRLAYVGLVLLAVLALPVVITIVADAVAALQDQDLAPRYKTAILNFAAMVTGTEHYHAYDASTAGRASLFRTGVDMILNAPWFGWGFEAFKYRALSDLNTENAYVHNILLELWSEGGIVSVLLFLSFTTWGFRIGLRRCLLGPSRIYNRVFFGIAAGSFIHMQVSLTLAFAKPLFFGLGAVITADALHRAARLKRRRRHRRSPPVAQPASSSPTASNC
ncbi:MAG: O-antigen ligase family protein [Hyphomicrobiales bacterium]|nr:O-antigen ligase family protein [Hyphomicrobiales bacterium]